MDVSTFLIFLFDAEQEVSEAQCPSALDEPPAEHFSETFAGLEDFERQRHEEIVEKEVHREFQHRLIRRPSDGEKPAGDVTNRPDHNQASEDQTAAYNSAKGNLPELSGDIAFQDITDRMDCRIVGISDEVKDSVAHDLSTHPDEEREMKHVACPYEPVDEC